MTPSAELPYRRKGIPRMKEQPELKIYELPVADLVPYARNAKEHSASQVDTIAASIEEFGNCDPIAVWHNAEGDPEIVEGHGRLLALKKLGHDVAPVIYLDHLSDEQRRAYTHVHNQTTLNSDFDYEVLLPELHELEATTGLDFDDFGFELGDGGEVEELSEDYSQNVGTVTYEPRDTHHEVSDLYSMDDKFESVVAGVDDEELREMLRLRAVLRLRLREDRRLLRVPGDPRRAARVRGYGAGAARPRPADRARLLRYR